MMRVKRNAFSGYYAMFRKPTDKLRAGRRGSWRGGADFTTRPFHSAVLLLAAFEGAERRENMLPS